MAEFRHLVRILGTDLDGNKKLLQGLKKIKGVSFMLANAICVVGKLDTTKIVGELTDKDVETIESVFKDIHKNVPSWLLNRRKDLETGEDLHLIGSTLTYQNTNDIKRMKSVKSYKGLRHQWGYPVRGQKTESNFRKNKGKGIAGKKKGTVRK